jgi:hypothetical protein
MIGVEAGRGKWATTDFTDGADKGVRVIRWIKADKGGTS